MGKKGTKRKTTWRTLSITDSVGDAILPANVSTEQNSEEASSKDDRYQSSSYLRRKPFFSSSSNVRNDSRGDYSRNYYKQNSAFSSSSSYSSRNSYHRRPFQNSASRFFSYRTGRSNSYSYRGSDANKENSQSKPLFNEEEYTRITTPRQDVIFKKGYLSQPRKYLSSTDTNTTSSAAASVVSTEESISAASVPSLSPEQCSSYADSVDPEQAFMYSYFDQNGVFYVNPCLPNGFDQYAGQMFMLPYSYPPYSVYPPDLNSPMQSTDVEENPMSTDSTENLSDKETNIKNATEEVASNCDSKSEPQDSEKTLVNNSEENADENAPKEADHPEITNAPFENFYNCGYPPPFYPPVFIPYMYGQPFVPVMEAEYESCEDSTEESAEDVSNCQKEKRMRANSEANSIGATAVDSSEKDCNDAVEDANISAEKEASCDTVIELKLAINQETEKKITFNANAEEFIPRTLKPHLNVNVKEFLPTNCKSDESAGGSSETNSLNSTTENKNENLPEISTKSEAQQKEPCQQPKAQREPRIKTKQIPTSAVEKDKEKPKLTLAERIKMGLTKEIVIPEKSSPPKAEIKNATNLVNKKNPKRNERRAANEKTALSFAQMLTKGNQRVSKSVPSTPGAVSININDKIPAKDIAKLNESDTQPNKVQSQTTAEKIAAEDEWRTVKPKGKRRLFKDNVMSAESEVEYEQTKSSKREEEVNVKIAVVPEKAIETVEKVAKNPVVETIILEDASVTEKSVPTEISNESTTPTVDQIDEEVKETSLQNSEKKVKNRNKKQKKSSSSTKKTKDREISKELSNKSTEKTDNKQKSNSKSLEVKEVHKMTRPVLMVSDSSEEDLALDNLYLLDRKNYLLTKNFCRNPLELLNGFDCKFKGNNGILKEEEEMVLNVIKSLSTTQGRQQENKIASEDSPKERVDLDKSSVNNNSTCLDVVNEDDINGIEIEGTGECDVVANLLNGNKSDSAEINICLDIEQNIVMKALPDDVAGKISDTESVSDLSSEDSGTCGSEKSLEKKNDFNTSDHKNDSSLESEEKFEKDNDSIGLSTQSSELENEETIISYEKTNGDYCSENGDAKNFTTASESIVPSDITDTNCAKIDITATNTNSALLLHDSRQSVLASTDLTNNEIASDDCNESDLFQIEMIKFNHCEEKLDIKAIFEAKMRDIEEQLEHASSSILRIHEEEKAVTQEESLPKEPCQTNGLQLEVGLTKEENTINSSSPEISKDTLFSLEITNNIEKCELNTSKAIENEILITTCSTTSPVENGSTHNVETEVASSVSALLVKECQLDSERILDKESDKFSVEEVVSEPIFENFNSISDDVKIPEVLEPKRLNECPSENCNYVKICSNTPKDSISSCVDSDFENMSVTNSNESEQNLSSSYSSENNNEPDPLQTDNEKGHSCNISGHLDATSTSDYHSSTEIHDSKETLIKNDYSGKTDVSSYVTIETTTENTDDLSKYPLTMAVRHWLLTEAKEQTPEPIFRVPDDPKLNSIITSSIIEQAERNNESCTWTSDESEEDEDVKDDPVKRPKNLQSNPSHVSSVNSLSLLNDNDSDYNSDSQQRYEEDDNTCERVAINTSDINRSEKFDLLDYWDDEFIRDPKKWLDSKRCASEENESMLSTTLSESMTPYESVYGKSIDYNQLLASNYEFLSNNIVSFNESSTDGKTEKARDVGEITNGTWLDNNNFGNVNRCLKAPEVCCIIM